jgi:hypothetical protein
MSESLLRTHVYELRRVLGDGVIETVVGRGYRFVAEVHELECTQVPEQRSGRAGRADNQMAVTPSPAGTSRAGHLKRIADALAALSPEGTAVMSVGDSDAATVWAQLEDSKPRVLPPVLGARGGALY